MKNIKPWLTLKKDPHFGFQKVPINLKLTFVAKTILDINKKALIHM